MEHSINNKNNVSDITYQSELMQFKIFDLGLVDFKQAESFQRDIFNKVKEGRLKSALILCRHYPVISIGRMGRPDNILATDPELKDRGINICQTDRGGDVTYHGPGQLLAYPIFNLSYFNRDIHLFLRYLEEIIVRVLSEFGIFARQKYGLTGVWVEDKKIASIGITIKNWITYHGLAINIKSSDLANFSLIRPCGMDIIMTSMEDVLGGWVEINDVKETLTRRLQNDQGSFTGIRRRD